MCFRIERQEGIRKPSELLKKVYKHKINKTDCQRLQGRLGSHKRSAQNRFSDSQSNKNYHFPFKKCQENRGHSGLSVNKNSFSTVHLVSMELPKLYDLHVQNQKPQRRSEIKVKKHKTQLFQLRQDSLPRNQKFKLPSCVFCDVNDAKLQDLASHRKQSNLLKGPNTRSSNVFLRNMKKQRIRSRLKSQESIEEKRNRSYNKTELQKTIEIAIKKNQMNLRVNFKSNESKSMKTDEIRKLISTQLLKIRMRKS